jgi:hypothetical protein
MGSWEEKERRARDGERGSGVEEHVGPPKAPAGWMCPTQPSARRRGNDRTKLGAGDRHRRDAPP